MSEDPEGATETQLRAEFRPRRRGPRRGGRDASRVRGFTPCLFITSLGHHAAFRLTQGLCWFWFMAKATLLGLAPPPRGGPTREAASVAKSPGGVTAGSRGRQPLGARGARRISPRSADGVTETPCQPGFPSPLGGSMKTATGRPERPGAGAPGYRLSPLRGSRPTPKQPLRCGEKTGSPLCYWPPPLQGFRMPPPRRPL